MPVDLPQLTDMLKKADAAGDTASATRLAQEIRNRRAMGGQSDQTPAPLGDDETDLYPGVAKDFDGKELPDDLRASIAEAQKLQDPVKKRRATSEIAGRLAAYTQENGFGTGAEAFATNFIPFGLGDLVATAGQYVGHPDSEQTFGDMYAMQQAYGKELRRQNPKSSIAGEVGGALVGGGALLKGAQAVAKGTRAAPVIEALTQFNKGKTTSNIAKASAAGAAGAGVTEFNKGEDAATGAMFGAIGGPLGPGLAKAAQLGTFAGKAAFRAFASDEAANGLRALAKHINMPYEKLAERFYKFRTVMGKPPTTAELLDEQAAKNLDTMIADYADAAQTVRTGAEDLAGKRQKDLVRNITSGGPTTTVEAEKAARDAAATKLFSDAEADDIAFTAGEIGAIFEDKTFRDIISKPLKRSIDEAVDAAGAGNPITLPAKLVNAIRKEVKGIAQNANTPAGVADEATLLGSTVENRARSGSKKLGTAIDDFAARSSKIEGVQQGRKVISQDQDAFQAAIDAEKNANFRAGAREGARGKIAAEGGKSLANAQRVAQTLSQDGAVIKKLEKVLPPGEIAKLREVGDQLTQSFRNISALTPKVRAEVVNSAADAVDTAASTLVALGAAGNAGVSFKYHIVKATLKKFLGRGMTEKAANNMAKKLVDPKATREIIDLLRKQGKTNEQILNLYTSLALGSGELAGDLANKRR